MDGDACPWSDASLDPNEQELFCVVTQSTVLRITVGDCAGRSDHTRAPALSRPPPLRTAAAGKRLWSLASTVTLRTL